MSQTVSPAATKANYPQLRPWAHRVLQANLIAQAGIVVTGALVRLTSSGLGCPTWPECVEGSITPTSEQTETWHKYIEFGNRTLTFVLVAISVLVIFAIAQHNRDRVNSGFNKRSQLKWLSLGTLAGIFAQAILGGITVLTGLNPISVASHFLLSMGLITVANRLLFRAQENEDGPILNRVHPALALGITFQTYLALAVIVLGTVVTGSGPHAGDSAEVKRLPIDPRLISWLHADVVLLFLGLSVGIWISLKVSNAPQDIKQASWLVILVCIAQGIIGYTQYFTGLPWALVLVHVIGSCVLWIATLRLFELRNSRGISE